MEANPTPTIDLTLDQQWVIHHALLEYVAVASTDNADLPEPIVELTILEKIEAGTLSFTACELQRLRHERSIGSHSSKIPDLFVVSIQPLSKRPLVLL